MSAKGAAPASAGLCAATRQITIMPRGNHSDGAPGAKNVSRQEKHQDGCAEHAMGDKIERLRLICHTPPGEDGEDQHDRGTLHQQMRHRRQSRPLEQQHGPEQRRDCCRHGECAPPAQPRNRIGGPRHGSEIGHKRPCLRTVSSRQDRRGEGADQPERRQKRPMQRRRDHRARTNRSEQDDRQDRADEPVKRKGRIGRTESACGSGCSHHRCDMRRAEAGNHDGQITPAQEFARAEQHQRKGGAEPDPCSRAEQPLLQREAHQEDASQTKRETADPDRPARPKTLLDARTRCARARA